MGAAPADVANLHCKGITNQMPMPGLAFLLGKLQLLKPSNALQNEGTTPAKVARHQEEGGEAMNRCTSCLDPPN